MRTEPPDLDRAALGGMLEREWSFHATSIEYLPVGFGSHHWLAADAQGGRRFVTADRVEEAAGLERALAGAAALRDTAGLEFVVGPLATTTGGMTRRLGDFAVALFPFLDEDASASYASAQELLRLLGRLHAALPPGHVSRESFAIPDRDGLEEALGELDRPWTAGPLGEPARELLRAAASSVARRLDSYDELARAVRDTRASWVVTHGEPKSSNAVRDVHGVLRLVDWDTILVAPRERDLWLVPDPDASAWSEYVATAGPSTLDDGALRLYRSRWPLADVAAFVADFRRPHEETEDTVAALGYLGGSL